MVPATPEEVQKEKFRIYHETDHRLSHHYDDAHDITPVKYEDHSIWPAFKADLPDDKKDAYDQMHPKSYEKKSSD